MSKTLEELAEEYAFNIFKERYESLDYEEKNVYANAVIAFLAAYKAAAPQWISVKDRLPEKEGEYLAFGYSASDAARWIVVMYDPRDECWYELSSDWDWTDDVTHWQELPEPPKEES